MSATKKRPAGGPEPFVSVRASAGTGKTHALTTRMIRLLADGADVSDVFAATFARKAVRCQDPGVRFSFESRPPGG